LARAEEWLDINSTNKQQGVSLVAGVLERQLKDRSPALSTADSTYAGAQAVRAAFRLGRKDEAIQILTMSATLDPDSYELQYLARFLSREGWLAAPPTQ
jgi:hypothetical protein